MSKLWMKNHELNKKVIQLERQIAKYERIITKMNDNMYTAEQYNELWMKNEECNRKLRYFIRRNDQLNLELKEALILISELKSVINFRDN